MVSRVLESNFHSIVDPLASNRIILSIRRRTIAFESRVNLIPAEYSSRREIKWVDFLQLHKHSVYKQCSYRGCRMSEQLT
jgi:hypothetical protein